MNHWRRAWSNLAARAVSAARAAAPSLLFGLRLWLAICLALFVAFRLELDNSFWAGTSAALVCQPHLGASLRKGWLRMVGTLVGAVAAVVLSGCFPQNRAAFLIGLALWSAACGFVSTLLRNSAPYAAALAGYTAVVIASDELGATGGTNGAAFNLAVTRMSEIWIGIVCAGLVLAGTDLGNARRRLAVLLANLSAEIANRFYATLTSTGPDFAETQLTQAALLRKVVGLHDVIDVAIGEAPGLRYVSPRLRSAVEGLFASLAGCRTLAARLARSSGCVARSEAEFMLDRLPVELRLVLQQDDPQQWPSNPLKLRRLYAASVDALVTLRAPTASLRLLAEQTIAVLAGVSRALDGLASLSAYHADRRIRPLHRKLHVTDWLPPFVNAGRAFVTIVAVEGFWIISAWPNGAGALAWAAIVVLLFAPKADGAHVDSLGFTIGISLAAVCAAVIAFAVLPKVETFVGFDLMIGLYLVPAGALMALTWPAATFAAMAGTFVQVLSPTNQMVYDPMQFYNTALAIIAGCAVAALSFRLLPPLSPAFRARRLLASTLRDLRELSCGNRAGLSLADWEGRTYGRLEAMPDASEPRQRALLIMALAVGSEMIVLRGIAPQLGIGPDLDLALADLAAGDGGTTIAGLAEVDRRLATLTVGGEQAPLVGRARSAILTICDAWDQHRSYFDGRAVR